MADFAARVPLDVSDSSVGPGEVGLGGAHPSQRARRMGHSRGLMIAGAYMAQRKQ